MLYYFWSALPSNNVCLLFPRAVVTGQTALWFPVISSMLPFSELFTCEPSFLLRTPRIIYPQFAALLPVFPRLPFIRGVWLPHWLWRGGSGERSVWHGAIQSPRRAHWGGGDCWHGVNTRGFLLGSALYGSSVFFLYLIWFFCIIGCTFFFFTFRLCESQCKEGE